MSKTITIVIITLTIGIGGLIIFTPQYSRQAQTAVSDILGITSAGELPVNIPDIPKRKPDSEDHDIAAPIALAYDIESGRMLFEKEIDKLWAPASFNKLMTALVTAHTLSWDEVVTITREDTLVSTPRMSLLWDESITVGQLVEGMLIGSANDAAAALSRTVAGADSRFVELMNLMSQRLGMTQTLYKNSTGFDEQDQLTTASDQLTLALEVLKDERLAAIVAKPETTVASADGRITHRVISTNRLLDEESVFGMKTGFTDLARGNLIALAQNESGRRIITIIMGSETREVDTRELITWVFESYEF